MKRSQLNLRAYIILLGIALMAAIYYYTVHMNFLPDPEYSLMILSRYYNEKWGQTLHGWGILTEVCASIVYQLLGKSIVAVRVTAATIYFLAIFLSLILSVYSKHKKVIWYIVPAFFFLGILVNPGNSYFCGSHTEWYHVYPYDMHMEPIMVALFEIVLVQYLIDTTILIKYRVMLGIICTTIAVLFLKVYSDVVFVVAFLGPLIITLIIWLFRNKRKQFYWLLLCGVGGVVLLRGISLVYAPLKSLFAKQSVSGYGNWTESGFYGATNFIGLEGIWENISITITELLALYNVELTNQSLVSFYTLSCIIRIFCVISMLIAAVITIKNSLIREHKAQDIITQMLSWGFLLNIILVMCTSYGQEYSCSRYMGIAFFFGTIILCRSISEYLEEKGDSKQEKKAICVFFILCILIGIRPVWRLNDQQTQYAEELYQLADIIDANDLGNGVGGHWFANTLALMVNENHVVADGQITQEGGLWLWQDRLLIPINFFIDGQGWYDQIDENKMKEMYGEPDQIYTTEIFTLYYYVNGIKYY